MKVGFHHKFVVDEWMESSNNELELDSPIYDEGDFHIPTKTLLFNFISALYILTTTAHK